MRQFQLSCCGTIVGGKIPFECRKCGSTSFYQTEVDKEDRVVAPDYFDALSTQSHSGDETCETRPWGSFRVLLDEEGYKVKRIVVSPQQRLSLQCHRHRREVWHILSGCGMMQVGNRVWEVFEGCQVDINEYEVHRVTNESEEPFVFLELQTGVCQEDDIIRIEDDYGRTE